MKCHAAIDRIVDSLCDELDGATARQVDDHLRTCSACAKQAAELRRLWGELDRVPAPGPAALPPPGRSSDSGRRPWPIGSLGRAAAILILLGAGFLAGRVTASGGEPARSDGGRQFLLLIRGSAPEPEASEEQLFREYSDWGRRLARDDALIAAAELADDARWIRGVDDDEALGGFYLIRASDLDAAERIARSSPHVAHGGTVEIRPIAER